MPQIWLRPFMARTMVEDRDCVKPLLAAGFKYLGNPLAWCFRPAPHHHPPRIALKGWLGGSATLVS
jgi:hypothetical protein